MIFDKKTHTCPFNEHKPCPLSCMFAVGYTNSNDELIMINCKLEPKENSISLDPENALIHIAETLDKLLDYGRKY